MGITLSRGAEPNTVARVSLIAIEEHWNLPSAMAALKALPEDRRDDSLALSERGDTLAHLDDLDDRRIAAMDAQGIDVQVISLAPPGIGAVAPADALPLSREANDRAAEAVRRHPSRLRAFSTLPMAEPGAVAGELERAAGMGFVGTMVYGRTGSTPLDDPC
jgi:predicted TIM-barrel fold metal-dependent hydrolase